MDKNQIKQEAAQLYISHGPIEAARFIALMAFEGKFESNGAPYFGHLERVASGIPLERAKPVGWLHDLIEDVPGWTFEDLKDIGFDDYVVDGVRAVTKRDDDPYFDEMVKLSLLPQAVMAKRSDLRDNSNPLRMGVVMTEKHFERTKKYYLAYHYLTDVESGKITPGTAFGVWMAMQPAGKQDWQLFSRYSTEVMPAQAQRKPGGCWTPRP